LGHGKRHTECFGGGLGIADVFLSGRLAKARADLGALKGLRQDKSAESYLRVLLLPLGCGFSLRETIVRAQQAGLADLSDVALLKRLRKSKAWLQQLCCSLFAARRGSPVVARTPQGRLLDGSLVREPGKTGSQWRIHYSLRWPSLQCDYFKLTPVEGSGHGESLYQFPFAGGDAVLAERGYCHAEALSEVARQGAFFTVRLTIRRAFDCKRLAGILRRWSNPCRN
jgi:hypothetical protein